MAAGFAAGMARRDADEIIYIMGRFAQGLGCGRGGGVLFQAAFVLLLSWSSEASSLKGLGYIFVRIGQYLLKR